MLEISCESSVKQTIHMYVISNIIFSEKYEKHALRMSFASRDWHLKG